MGKHVHKCAVYECPELVECINNPCLEDVSIPTPMCCPVHQPWADKLLAILDTPSAREQLKGFK